MFDSKSISQYVDFFVKEEKPIPTTFFKEFSFSSKKEGVSNCAQKEKTFIDMILTNKTESNQEIINQGNSSINLDFEHFKTQELLNNKKDDVNITPFITFITFTTRTYALIIFFSGFIRALIFLQSSKIFKNQQLPDQIKKNPILSYKTDIQKILKYNTNRTYKAIIFSFLQETWEQIWERKLLPNLPSIINKIALEYSSMLNSFIPMKDIHDRWSNNFSKAVGLVSRNMEIFSQTQVIFQNFLFLCEKGIDTNNEDTFVHGMLHDLLNEIFRDPTFELIWANSERFVSKNCHTSTSGNKENNRGEKPDFKIITNLKEEILFDEIKPKDSTSLLLHLEFELVAHAFGFMKWISIMMEYIECF
ncbi:hypothetical protein GLOIN_2v1837855 [Rhizophagus irregularis DAOM 181602=DAOM 197198]|nr:hypothetical protein GLOIN_2v1837855 [Rhizophagus irregularis DAOM 181602=DAOM 197198]